MTGMGSLNVGHFLLEILPVVPHKAVAEVSRIGNLLERFDFGHVCFRYVFSPRKDPDPWIDAGLYRWPFCTPGTERIAERTYNSKSDLISKLP